MTVPEFMTLELSPRLGGQYTEVLLRGQVETVLDAMALAKVLQALRRWTSLRVDIALHVEDPCANHRWFQAWLDAILDAATRADRQMDLF